MQSSDTALKILLRNTRGLVLRELTGGAPYAGGASNFRRQY